MINKNKQQSEQTSQKVGYRTAFREVLEVQINQGPINKSNSSHSWMPATDRQPNRSNCQVKKQETPVQSNQRLYKMFSKIYKPLHFLRLHAKNNYSADVSTQVWACEFEPDAREEGRYTNIVATCGGNSVCFTDVATGTVQHKFNTKNESEQLYCLAWGSPSGWGNILAVSGTKSLVYLITPSQSSCLCSKALARSKVVVNALLFHSKQPILYCGCSNGEIVICEVDPKNCHDPLKVVNRLEAPGQSNILQLTFNVDCSTLLAASDTGLCAWTCKSGAYNSYNKKGLPVKLPAPVGTKTSGHCVDTVINLSGSLVASKTALEGHILVWDLATALAKHGKNKAEIRVTEGRFLRWSSTDNYYMAMGWDNKRKVVACGDDKGCTWLYDLSETWEQMNDLSTPALQVTSMLHWPKKIRDVELDKVRKLPLDSYDIVIAKVTLANNYLVAVTNNNMVCVWSLVRDEQMYS